MATTRQIEEFIENAKVSEAHKKALLRRLRGISQSADEELSEEHLSAVFEGLPDLKSGLLSTSH